MHGVDIQLFVLVRLVLLHVLTFLFPIIRAKGGCQYTGQHILAYRSKLRASLG